MLWITGPIWVYHDLILESYWCNGLHYNELIVTVFWNILYILDILWMTNWLILNLLYVWKVILKIYFKGKCSLMWSGFTNARKDTYSERRKKISAEKTLSASSSCR